MTFFAPTMDRSQLGQQSGQGAPFFAAQQGTHRGELRLKAAIPADDADLLARKLLNETTDDHHHDSIKESSPHKGSDDGCARCGFNRIDIKHAFPGFPHELYLPAPRVEALQSFDARLFRGNVGHKQIPASLRFFRLGQRPIFLFAHRRLSFFGLFSRQSQGDKSGGKLLVADLDRAIDAKTPGSCESFKCVKSSASRVGEVLDAQRQARQIEAPAVFQSGKIGDVEKAHVADNQVTFLKNKSVGLPFAVIAGFTIRHSDTRNLLARHVDEAVQFQRRDRSVSSGARKSAGQRWSQGERRSIGDKNVADAGNGHDRASQPPFASIKRFGHERLKERFGQFQFRLQRLFADRFLCRKRHVGGNVAIADGIARPECQRGRQSFAGEFAPALDEASGSGDLIDFTWGKKCRGISAASLRAYQWPPCQGSLWNGFFSRNHWEAIPLKSLDNSSFYIDLASKVASDATLDALMLTNALSFKPLALN